jgi:hypothetical protein
LFTLETWFNSGGRKKIFASKLLAEPRRTVFWEAEYGFV